MTESPDLVRPAGRDGGGSEYSLSALVAVGLRHARPILLCGLAPMLLQGLRGYFADREYSTATVFMADMQTGQLTQAVQLARRLGLNLDGGGRAHDMYVFEELLGSRSLRDAVATRTYRVMVDEELKTTSLPELLEIDAGDEARRTRRARAWLNQAVQVDNDLASAIFTIRVRTPWPHVSMDIARHFVDELDSFNVERRQSRSQALVAFVNQQLTQTKMDRDSVQEALRAFTDANRAYGQWSPLSVEAERLEADVNRLNSLYENLQIAYTDARIEALRDTPTIAVIQPPYLPTRPVSRGIVRSGASGFVGGCVAAFMAVLLLHYYRTSSLASHGELRKAWDDFVAPIPLLRRLFRT